MRYKYKACILLTGCVRPSGMSHTELQDPDIRANQYKQALDYYINETNLPIVFCENTMYDIGDRYCCYIDCGRLEYLTFDGNNYDKQRGKGYGEALIMSFALDNSKIISHSKYIIKITGRLIVTDVMRLSKSPLLFFNNIFRSNIKEEFISTYLFISRPSWMKKFIDKYQNLIWEDSPTYDLIEHHWYRALAIDPELSNPTFIPFISIPHVVGISGTTGKPYNMEDRRIWNLAYSYKLELTKNNRIKAYVFLLGYYLFYFAKKLSIRFR